MQRLYGVAFTTQEELDQLVCEADLRLVLRDAGGNLAFTGRRARTFSPAKRLAILAANPTCAFEGCTRPAVDCDVHHTDEYVHGGETTVQTGGPACYLHHPMLHMEGWALVARGDGTFQTLSPGHPDNPKSKADAEEYMRFRRDGIFGRMGARRRQQMRRRTESAAPGLAPPGFEPPAPGPPSLRLV